MDSSQSQLLEEQMSSEWPSLLHLQMAENASTAPGGFAFWSFFAVSYVVHVNVRWVRDTFCSILLKRCMLMKGVLLHMSTQVFATTPPKAFESPDHLPLRISKVIGNKGAPRYTPYRYIYLYSSFIRYTGILNLCCVQHT